jgi:hypothetical protein
MCEKWKLQKMDRAKRKSGVPTPISDLTPSHFYLKSDLRNTVHARKQTLQDLRHEIGISCAAVIPATMRELCHSVARSCQ